MKRMFLIWVFLLVSFVLLPAPRSYAIDVVQADRMTNNEPAVEGLRNLVQLLRASGLRTSDLEAALVGLGIHEEGAPAAGLILADQDSSVTLLRRRTFYNGFSVFSSNPHIVFRGTVIKDLEDKEFGLSSLDLNESAKTAIRELLRVMIFRTRCFEGNADDQKNLVHTLEGHIATKASAALLAEAGDFTTAINMQKELNNFIPELLRRQRTWKTCYAALGHLFVSVDFDTFSDGVPVPEGLLITDQYAASGALFSISETLFSPDNLLIDDNSGLLNTFRGMTAPNTLALHSYGVGTANGQLGCNADLRVDFVDPSTHLPTVVGSVSIRVFAGVNSDPQILQLVARDSRGRVLSREQFAVESHGFPTPESFTLMVFDKKKRIASVVTEGITQNGICVAFDNLGFLE